MRRGTHLPAAMDGFGSSYCAKAHLWNVGCWITDRPRWVFSPDAGSKSCRSLLKLSMDDSTKSLRRGDRRSSWCFLPASNRSANRKTEHRMWLVCGERTSVPDFNQSLQFPKQCESSKSRTRVKV